MPTVGKGKNARHFAYTPAGVKEAKEEAKEKGLPLKMRKLSTKPAKAKK